MELIFSLLQQLSVYLVIAYLLSKTPLFLPLTSVSGHFSQRLVCYLLFSLFCIMGTYFGLAIENAIANTRAIGAVLGGLFGGPLVGFLVGLTGGIHRYSMGGFTDFACAVSTTAEGLLGGLVHSYFVRRGSVEKLFKPALAFGLLVVAEVMQMSLILLIAKPFEQALHLVQAIALPMMIANALGAALFISIIQDRKAIYEKYSAAFSSKALKIAERTVGILNNGFNQHTTKQVAQVIYEETGVAAVSITDREKILAFIGLGHDHHLPNTAISSVDTKQAIRDCEIIYLDGYEAAYQCSLSPHCKLGSALVIPLVGEDHTVLGTIKLYEPKQKLFSALNRSLGEGLAKLLSNQILTGRFIEQQRLLTQAELKLLQAQVNPHFLFNALNTISAITRHDPHKARGLIQHLSQFFRRNLKHNIESVSLEEELAHIKAYLEVELARFADNLSIEFDIDPRLLPIRVPTFTLQPLVENAIKHGTSNLIGKGQVQITGSIEQGADLAPAVACLHVTDNAGNYVPQLASDGLGLQLVDKRLKNRFGQAYGLNMHCEAQVSTTASIRFPLNNAEPSSC